MSVELETELSKPFPAGGGRSTVEVTIRPVEKQQPTTRQVVLLVDASGSMGPDRSLENLPETKIERARSGVARVLDELDDGDHVALVSFDHRPEVHLSMTRWGRADESRIRKMVFGTSEAEYDGDLEATGGTDIHAAIEKARAQFAGMDQGRSISRDVILLSDGKDERDLGEFETLAADLADDGITVSAGGIGSSYKEEVLLALTEESGGEAYHIQDPDDIDSFLEARVQEAGDTVASDPELRVDLADEFMIDEAEPAWFTSPSNQSRPVETGPEGGTVDLPKLTVGKEQRLTFRVLGMHRPTGLSYPMGELKVVDDGPIATASLEAAYADEPEAKERIEKERASAKVTAAITDSSVEKEAVSERIDELETERGWTKTAAELRKRLAEAEEAGGKIGISKERLDPDD